MLGPMRPDVFRLAPNVIVAMSPTGHPGYDFDFRTWLDVRSVYGAEPSDRLLVRIGAIEDYGAVASLAADIGCALVNDRAAHVRASELPAWYPLLQDLTPESR